LKNFSIDIPEGRHFDFKTTGISVNESRISQESTKIEGEKIVIRNSVVGEMCEIGSNVKITGSVIMKGAKINKGLAAFLIT
jgi:NDP-sugar pyrophosphorylase family protein